MFSLRCTRKLLQLIEATPLPIAKTPTTGLGDWYANLIPTCRGGIVMCTNERTLLTVVLPLIERQHPLDMFLARVFNLLRHIGIPNSHAERELREMNEMKILKSQNRRVLGSMNDIALNIRSWQRTTYLNR